MTPVSPVFYTVETVRLLLSSQNEEHNLGMLGLCSQLFRYTTIPRVQNQKIKFIIILRLNFVFFLEIL